MKRQIVGVKFPPSKFPSVDMIPASSLYTKGTTEPDNDFLMYTSKQYFYYTDEEHYIGQPLVVNTGGHEFKIVYVSQINGFTKADYEKCKKWIVQSINVKLYEDRMDKEKLIQDIKAELRQAKEEAEEFLIYQTLAKGNERIQKLLNQFNELTGQNLLKSNEDSK